MTAPLLRKVGATYADIEALPPGVNGQLIDGELFASARPASRHGHAAGTLGMDLGSSFQRGRGGPGGWWIQYEPELHLGGDVMVPDLAGWRRERLPTPGDVAFYTLAPDWLCEVLSPSTAGLDRVRKLPKYAAAGVAWVWIVDPLARSLEVKRLTHGLYADVAAFEGDAAVRAEPFDAIELELGALWIPEPTSP